MLPIPILCTNVVVVETFFMRSAATFTYIPRNYNYFSVKKKPETCSCHYGSRECVWIQNNNVHIYMSTQGRRKREHYPTTILIRAYTYIISLSFCLRLFCHISFVFKMSAKLLLLHALRILNAQVMCDVCIYVHNIYRYLIGLYLCYATVLPLKFIACPFYRRWPSAHATIRSSGSGNEQHHPWI